MNESELSQENHPPNHDTDTADFRLRNTPEEALLLQKVKWVAALVVYPRYRPLSTQKTIIDGVPAHTVPEAGYCLAASAYMVVSYWQKRTHFSPVLPAYEDFRKIFPRSDILLATPPNKIYDHLRKVEQTQNVRVRHLTGNDVSTLEFRVREKSPPIVLFDCLHYHQRSPLSKSSHATVIVGYTNELLLANNPVFGAEYPYEKRRFVEAWARRGMRYILITPTESLARYMGTK